MNAERSPLVSDDGLPPVRDLGVLAWVVAALLGAQVVGTIAISLSVFYRTFIADSEALWELENALLRPDQALFFLTGIVFLVWFYRAHQNLRRLGAEPEHASGFAVGAWLIPIGNLWFPYQVAADIWRNSAGPVAEDVANERRERGVGLVGAWWGLYVGMNLSSMAAQFFVASVNTGVDTGEDSFAFANTMVIIANLITVAAAVCAIRMVFGITQRQRESASTSPVPVVF